MVLSYRAIIKQTHQHGLGGSQIKVTLYNVYIPSRPKFPATGSKHIFLCHSFRKSKYGMIPNDHCRSGVHAHCLRGIHTL